MGYSNGFDMRYLHRLGPVYLGANAGYRNREFGYIVQDAIYVPKVPFRYSEEGTTNALYALASLEWHVPLWRWLRPLWVWRWVRPLLGVDVGAGWVHQNKQSIHAQVPAPEWADIANDGVTGSSEVYESVGDEWSRSLPAFHARLRAGLMVPLHERVRLEATALLGFDISAEEVEGDRRSLEVASPDLFIPQLGFTSGVVVAF